MFILEADHQGEADRVGKGDREAEGRAGSRLKAVAELRMQRSSQLGPESFLMSHTRYLGSLPKVPQTDPRSRTSFFQPKATNERISRKGVSHG